MLDSRRRTSLGGERSGSGAWLPCARGAGAGDGRVGGGCWRSSRCCWLGLVAAGVRVPGSALARAVASRILCAAALADRCGDEPVLIAAYGTEVGKLVRRAHAWLALRAGLAGGAGRLPALPQHGLRRRRRHGFVRRTDAGLPVTAFVHVVDCRADEAAETKPRRRLLRLARRQPLHPVLDLLRRLRHPARHPDRRRDAATTATTGRGSRSASAPTATSTSAPPPTTATTTPRAVVNWGSDAGIEPAQGHRGSGRPAPRTAGGPRPTCCSSPAAATPATPPASPHRPPHPRPPRPPDPARADRRHHDRRFAINPPGARRSGATPRPKAPTDRPRIGIRPPLTTYEVANGGRITSAASAGRRRGGSSRR